MGRGKRVGEAEEKRHSSPVRARDAAPNEAQILTCLPQRDSRSDCGTCYSCYRKLTTEEIGTTLSYGAALTMMAPLWVTREHFLIHLENFREPGSNSQTSVSGRSGAPHIHLPPGSSLTTLVVTHSRHDPVAPLPSPSSKTDGLSRGTHAGYITHA
ncbi:hypothetical protein E2C01_026545 [Portunus trituberculatus]|uniref:Uncharacterized protein n=1 Tax=Portunus trituberculatus TaxID=210409 RepID=A0A5B7EFV7_PORTR|nr:hypothetical protein [Portunus trituberculatus]